MASPGRAIPTKLKDDAILEALIEIRFELTAKTLPEIFFGKLAEYAPWANFQHRAMPASQIPSELRRIEPNFRYQPVFELVSGDKLRVVRVGPRVLSYHRFSPYVGWAKFRPEIAEVVSGLFAKSGGVKVGRLGLRYMNALRLDLHGIPSINHLDLKVQIGGVNFSGNMNVNFTTDVGRETASTVRVATPGFVNGKLPPSSSVYVDVDVFTKGIQSVDESAVMEWMEFAHTKEKEQFFSLLTDQTIDSLKES